MEPAGDFVTKLPSSSKTESLIRALQNYIIDSGLKPGMPIMAEREMASRFGVGRYSLREALRVAQSQGLIEINQGCRPRVAKPSPQAAAQVLSLNIRRSAQTLTHLIEARIYIECGIARYAAQRRTDAHVRALSQTIADMDSHKQDTKLCVDRDLDFHNILLQAADNEVFQIMLQPVAELLRESRDKTMAVNVERAISGHRAIRDAVCAGNPDQAEQAMRSHLAMAQEDIGEQ
ncbi:MAG: FadR family transcriptional regulator [Phycisphaerae bacterium]|nr:FadR family transcriptional regulator [Phycisphaerae bacterium]